MVLTSAGEQSVTRSYDNNPVPYSFYLGNAMKSSLRAALTFVILAMSSRVSNAQTDVATAWDSVGKILKTAATATGGYQRYNLPRRDITLHVGDVTVSPALALGAWAGFSGSPRDAMMMGDLVLTSAELKPVLAELGREHIAVTAIHNHLTGDDPHLTYLHFHGQGRAVDLATRLDRALALTGTPRPVAAAAPKPATFDTAMVFRALGTSGKAQGDVAQVSYILVPGRVTMHGHTIVPALGYGSPVNVQMIDASRAVATGDFAVLGSKVDGVLTALATHGITATALHSHLIGEQPTIYYIHFWADGPQADVLRGLRAAIDAGR